MEEVETDGLNEFLPFKTGDGSYTMVHPEHGETYHSKAGAYYEAKKLYVEESGFLEFLNRDPNAASCSVLDVGLGLGYNALTTIEAWTTKKTEKDLLLISLEVDQTLIGQFASGAAPWQLEWSERWLALAKRLEQVSANEWSMTITHPKSPAKCRWKVISGDAMDWDPASEECGFDFIWQDPFSPKKNPKLWSEGWFQKITKYCNPEVRLMAYSVARVVKDGLANAGWDYEIIESGGPKRHWLKAGVSDAVKKQL